MINSMKALRNFVLLHLMSATNFESIIDKVMKQREIHVQQVFHCSQIKQSFLYLYFCHLLFLDFQLNEQINSGLLDRKDNSFIKCTGSMLLMVQFYVCVQFINSNDKKNQTIEVRILMLNFRDIECVFDFTFIFSYFFLEFI